MHLVWPWSVPFLLKNKSIRKGPADQCSPSTLPPPISIPSFFFPSLKPCFSLMFSRESPRRSGVPAAPLSHLEHAYIQTHKLFFYNIFFLKMLKTPTLIPSRQWQKSFSLYLHYLLFQLLSNPKVNIREYSIWEAPCSVQENFLPLSQAHHGVPCTVPVLEQDCTSTLGLSATSMA